MMAKTNKEKFITKETGKKTEFDSGLQREVSEDKPRFDLIFPKGQKYENTIMYRLAMLLGRGAKKYADRNWEKGKSIEEAETFKKSAIRHFTQWFTKVDDGEDHAAAVIFNMSAYEFIMEKVNNATKK